MILMRTKYLLHRDDNFFSGWPLIVWLLIRFHSVFSRSSWTLCGHELFQSEASFSVTQCVISSIVSIFPFAFSHTFSLSFYDSFIFISSCLFGIHCAFLFFHSSPFSLALSRMNTYSIRSPVIVICQAPKAFILF